MAVSLEQRLEDAEKRISEYQVQVAQMAYRYRILEERVARDEEHISKLFDALGIIASVHMERFRREGS